MSKPLIRAGLDTIGLNGLDTQTTPTTLSPTWLTSANNIAYTEGGKITFRKGLHQRSLAQTAKIGSIGEYTKDNTVFAAIGDTIYTVNLTDPDDAFTSGYNGGTPDTFSDSDWQFVNFNNSLFGIQKDNHPVKWNGTTWAMLKDVTGYEAPTGFTAAFTPSCALGHFGRLWVGGVTTERDVVFYSNLLDEKDFNDAADAGLIDLKTVWGTDEIVAISDFGGKLVIFGKENIVLYNNPTQPNAMELDEVIQGIGCISRDSIQAIGDDIFFLSDTGVRSLLRTAEKDKLPLQDKSKTIKDDLIGKIRQNKNVKSAYMQDEGLYLLSFVDLNITYVFDLAYITEKDTPRVTTWTFKGGRDPSSFLYTEHDGLIIGQNVGCIATYEGYSDTVYGGSTTWTEVSYTSGFSTPWLTLDEGGNSAILRRLQFVVDGGEGTNANIRLYKDFSIRSFFSEGVPINPPQSGSKFFFRSQTTENLTAGSLYKAQTGANLASATKYAPTYGFSEKSVPLTGSAKYLKLEMDATTAGYKASLQGVSLLFLQGKTR